MENRHFIKWHANFFHSVGETVFIPDILPVREDDWIAMSEVAEQTILNFDRFILFSDFCLKL